MLWTVVGTCVALVVYVVGAQRRIERRLESIERHLVARVPEWE